VAEGGQDQAAGGGGGHPLGHVEAGLDRMDALHGLRHRQGHPDDGHRLEGRQHEDGGNQYGLEQVDRVDLVAVLEVQCREDNGEQHQEGEHGRPGCRLAGGGDLLGEQRPGDAGGGERGGEDQDSKGKGTLWCLSPCRG